MLRNVFGKTLWDQRRGIAGWAVGIAAIGVLYAVFYPTINTPEMRAAMEAFPPGLLEAMGIADMTTPAGYLGATTFGILGPILMVVYATALGSRAIAGDEEGGRLDVLLAHPVSRWQVIVQRALAGLVALAVAGAVLFLALVVITPFAQLEAIGAERFAAATVALVLLGACFGSLALAVGAVTGRRMLAGAAVAVVGVVTYFGNTLGPSIEWLAWLQSLSPFFYYSGGEPLRNGLQVVDAGVLLLASVVMVALGGFGFARRDVAV